LADTCSIGSTFQKRSSDTLQTRVRLELQTDPRKNQISNRSEQPICLTEILSEASECRRADKQSKMLNSADQSS
jgi:hypothetical protein